MDKAEKFFGALAGVLLVGWLVVSIQPSLINNTPKTDNVGENPVVPIKYVQDAKLVAYANQLGIDVSKINITYKDHLEADDILPGNEVIGVFQPPNNIWVKPQIASEELETVAYEYMHYVWANLPDSERQMRTSQYKQYFVKDPEMQYYMDGISCDDSCLGDESHAIACTIMDPTNWNKAFNAYCDRAIPNRSILF